MTDRLTCRDKNFENTDPFGGIGHYNNLEETCHHPRCCGTYCERLACLDGSGPEIYRQVMGSEYRLVECMHKLMSNPYGFILGPFPRAGAFWSTRRPRMGGLALDRAATYFKVTYRVILDLHSG